MDRKRVRVQARTVAPDQNEIMPYSYVVFTDQTYQSLMEHYLDRTGMHDDNVIWRTSDLRPLNRFNTIFDTLTADQIHAISSTNKLSERPPVAIFAVHVPLDLPTEDEKSDSTSDVERFTADSNKRRKVMKARSNIRRRRNTKP